MPSQYSGPKEESEGQKWQETDHSVCVGGLRGGQALETTRPPGSTRELECQVHEYRHDRRGEPELQELQEPTHRNGVCLLRAGTKEGARHDPLAGVLVPAAAARAVPVTLWELVRV